MDCDNSDTDLQKITCEHPEFFCVILVITVVFCWCLAGCICDRRSRGGGRYGSLP